jgi:hypothetical protein
MIKENRVTKYVLYATGEIVLVVIGILIALQINNWNEGQKDQKLIASYTENLIEDLVLDSISISERIIRIEADSTNLADFERRVFQSLAPLDTIYQIARYEYGYYIWVHPDFNNDTYEVLNSTGDIGLFDKELISDLNALFNLQELALNATRHTMESYVNNVHSYAKKYPVPFQSNLIKNGSPAAELIWGQISLIDHATEFNALVLAKGDSYRLALRHLPVLLEKTNALLAKLRKQ